MTDSRALYAGLPYDSEQTLDIYKFHVYHISVVKRRELCQSEVSIRIWGVKGLCAPTRVSGVNPPVSSQNHPTTSNLSEGSGGLSGLLKTHHAAISTVSGMFNPIVDLFLQKLHVFSHHSPNVNYIPSSGHWAMQWVVTMSGGSTGP